MSEAGTRPHVRLMTPWIRLRDRIAKHAFIAFELLMAWLSRTPKQRILFSDTKKCRNTIERSFRFTPHEIHFGEFRPDTLADFDVLIPLLRVGPVRRLDELRTLAVHNRLPIPSRAAIDICDDKLAFQERMIASGLSEFVPRIGNELPAPYVLKRRWGDSGKGIHLVLDDSNAHDLPANAGSDEYFRQELVPGRYEYTAHILFIDKRIRRALCIEHEMTQEAYVKGSVNARRQRIVRCRHLPVFARMLAALEFEGLCNIDFKLRDGKPLVMEVNPRVGASLCPYVFAFVRSLPRMPR
jgi:glutathione synthase/RimK-type ligase-like ATP-grasp enzyme